jgi:hypothetical protein
VNVDITRINCIALMGVGIVEIRLIIVLWCPKFNPQTGALYGCAVGVSAGRKRRALRGGGTGESVRCRAVAGMPSYHRDGALRF